MKRSTWMIIGASVAVGLASFLVTVKAAPSANTTTTTGGATSSFQPLCRWLALSQSQQQQVAQDDPTFEAEAATLRENVRIARERLAGMMEAAEASETDVLSQVDRVTAAENALQRRVTQYVLRIRRHLTSVQQQNLMGLCAQAVRGPANGQGMGMGMGMGMGRGMGGMGMGMGRGMMMRGNMGGGTTAASQNASQEQGNP